VLVGLKKNNIIINEYYYSAVGVKQLQEHSTTEKNKTNESVAQDKNCQRLNERLKSSVLSRRLKAISDGDVIMSDGRPDRSKRELRRLRKRGRRQ